MSSTSRWLILGFALLGLAFSGASAYVHYKLVTEPNYLSPCDINATFNCTTVYLSRYGAVGGVPVALFGVVWFALVGLIAWFTPVRPAAIPVRATATPAKSPVAPPPGGAYIFVLATIGLAVSLYLAYTSFFVLKTGCVLCMGTYVAVIGIFLVAGASSSAAVSSLPSRLSSDLRAIVASPAALLVALLFLVGSASLIAFFPKEAHAPANAAASATTAPPVDRSLEGMFTEAWWKMPRVDLGVPRDGAKVVVVKFIDWQCPSCRAAHFSYKPILDRYAQSHPGQVRQVIRDYPLSNKCNYTIPRPAHQAACEAAVGARMLRDKGREDDFVNWIFNVPDQQAVTATEMRAKVTSLLGISDQDFERQYNARIDAVKRDIADAVTLKVGSTPTYFINGVIAQGTNSRGDLTWLPPALFDLAIKLELEKPETK